MEVNDDAGQQVYRRDLKAIASKLAPTGVLRYEPM
jgi:hypothetical protein